MSIPAILSGVSLIGGLLSKHHSQYAGQAAADQARANGYMGQLGTLDSTYGQEAQAANNEYTADNGDYRSALGDLANYYKSNPYTDQYSQQMLAASNAGQYADKQAAQANILASAAQRGVSDSSSTNGALAGTETAYQGGLAQQRSQLALQAMHDQQTRRQALASLYGGASQNDYSKAQNAYGQQGELANNLANTYNGLYNQNTARDQAYQQQRYGKMMGGLSGIGGAYATSVDHGGSTGLAGIGSLFGIGQGVLGNNNNNNNNGQFTGHLQNNSGGAALGGQYSGGGDPNNPAMSAPYVTNTTYSG